MIKKLFANKNLIIISLVLIFAIFFETFQQYFYVKKFNLYANVQFFELLKNQMYRWIIWFIIGFSFLFFIKKDIKKQVNNTLILKYIGFVLLLVLINVFVVSIIQVLLSDEGVTIGLFFKEYFLFYFFQKSPVYTLGYIAIVIILFLNFRNELLQIEVQELIELKKTNETIYRALKESNSDKAKILNIKIGNSRKIIAVDNIIWLEADDYCVRVHTIDKPSYTMRASLKLLQEKLNTNFLRVHRKAIVNMSMVDEFKTTPKPFLILKGKYQVDISKSNLRKVKDFFNQ